MFSSGQGWTDRGARPPVVGPRRRCRARSERLRTAAGWVTFSKGSIIDPFERLMEMPRANSQSYGSQPGEVLTEISNGMVALLKEYDGAGPRRPRSTITATASSACARRFHPGRAALLAGDRGRAMIEQRMAFQEVMRARAALRCSARLPGGLPTTADRACRPSVVSTAPGPVPRVSPPDRADAAPDQRVIRSCFVPTVIMCAWATAPGFFADFSPGSR